MSSQEEWYPITFTYFTVPPTTQEEEITQGCEHQKAGITRVNLQSVHNRPMSAIIMLLPSRPVILSQISE